MKSRILGVLLALSCLMAWSQPYAPEQMPEAPPSFGESFLHREPLPATKEQATSTPDPATEKKLAAIRRSMQDQPTETEGEAGVADNEPDSGVLLKPSDYLRVVIWLLVIIAAILLLGAAMRKWGKKNPLLAGASLANIMGRVHLDKGVSLHFIETGGKVLIVGVAQNHVSLVSAFDKADFVTDHPSKEHPPTTKENEAPVDFLKHLQAQTSQMRASAGASPDDEELRSLQEDIARLQRYLKEEAREYSE